MKTPARQQLFALMGSIFNDTRKWLDEQFKALGLSRTEWLVLAMLRLNPNALTQAAALKYIGVEKSYFSKQLNTLEKKGYITREIDTSNRRHRLIKANPRAKQKVAAAFKLLADFTKNSQCDLSDKEIETLHILLTKIQNRVENKGLLTLKKPEEEL